MDLTALGLGRSIPDVQLVNASVDINIVVATGLYTFDELPTFFASRRPKAGAAEDVMVDMFVEDIEKVFDGDAKLLEPKNLKDKLSSLCYRNVLRKDSKSSSETSARP